MANPETVKRAFFKVQGSSEKIEVHFNPESLQYSITNNLKNKGSGNKKKQYVSDSTGKLTMDLTFDTTGSGEDVRLHTVKVAKFMEPKSGKTPPIVIFEWGLYTFKGMVESYKETIDFFSSDGVPLRASTNITMSSQDDVFEGGSEKAKAGTGGSAGLPNSAIPATAPSGTGATGVATQAGNPAAGKNIAASNGLESMRFAGSASLEIGGSVSLKGPAAFASGGAGLSLGGGLGIGGGAGIGIGGGAGIGAGIDLGLGVSAGASAGVSLGASASAGVSASAGAFSGLHTQSTSSRASQTLNLDKFIETDVTSNFGTSDQAAFSLGGGAGLQGSASMKAEVGQAGELKSKIEFDGG